MELPITACVPHTTGKAITRLLPFAGRGESVFPVIADCLKNNLAIERLPSRRLPKVLESRMPICDVHQSLGKWFTFHSIRHERLRTQQGTVAHTTFIDRFFRPLMHKPPLPHVGQLLPAAVGFPALSPPLTITVSSSKPTSFSGTLVTFSAMCL